MEKYTTTETKPKPEIVAHVAKTLDGVSEELAKDLVSSGVEIAIATPSRRRSHGITSRRRRGTPDI